MRLSFFTNLKLLALFGVWALLGPVAAANETVLPFHCELAYETLSPGAAFARRNPPVFPTLSTAIRRPGQSSDLSVVVEGVRVPRLSATSKWRATIVLGPERDHMHERGYISGWERNGTNIGNGLAAKYNELDGVVSYPFADGRTVQVAAREARALEFSYLDKINPRSPRNTIVVGVHDNPEHIVQVVRQAGAKALLDPNAYIRLDEISTEGLRLTSAEELYKRFNLSHPNYSVVGEFVSDGSIPAENLLNTQKFRAVNAVKTLKDLPGNLHVGEEVNYVALSGRKFRGTIADDKVIDDNVVISYDSGNGWIKYDLARIDTISRVMPAAHSAHAPTLSP